MEYTLRENTAMEQCGFSGAPACSFIMSFYYFMLSQKFQKITAFRYCPAVFVCIYCRHGLYSVYLILRFQDVQKIY